MKTWFVKKSDNPNGCIWNYFAEQDSPKKIHILGIDKTAGKAWIEYPEGNFQDVSSLIDPTIIPDKKCFAELVSNDIPALVLGNTDLVELFCAGTDDVELVGDFYATGSNDHFPNFKKTTPNPDPCHWKCFEGFRLEVSKMPIYSGEAFEEWILENQETIANTVGSVFSECKSGGAVPPNFKCCGSDYFQLDPPPPKFTRRNPPVVAGQGTCDLCDADIGEVPNHFTEAKICRGNTVAISYNNHRLLTEVTKTNEKSAWLIVARAWGENCKPTRIQVVGPRTMACIFSGSTSPCEAFKLSSRDKEMLFCFPKGSNWSLTRVTSFEGDLGDSAVCQ